jgi:adenine-specific DNA-methyltransferase
MAFLASWPRLDKVASRLRPLDALRKVESMSVPQPGLRARPRETLRFGPVAVGRASAEDRIRAELEQVESFAKRSAALPHDSKARCLLDALRIVRERSSRDQGTGRAIVFTESLTTQNYLRSLLLENGYTPEDITLFRGDNETPEARTALDLWEKEVASSLPAGNRPSREVALRLALVHEFRERSKVFISTEAGAKGLNLQFCDTLINR